MTGYDDDDDEDGFFNLYVDGHWVWDDSTGALVFISDLSPVEEVQMLTEAPTGIVQFRDDIDLIEQMRYRRRFQRKLKPGQQDIITLQDVKDIAIFTAPVNILSTMLINMLHLPTTERFLRALILYCQYYLQVADKMSERILELSTKVRTPDCKIIENEYRDNLNDLRLLVAKEYCTMLMGGGEMKRFHHMGPAKESKSLSEKDARLFETLLCMCVQIIWLALGRSSYNRIQLEVNRMFKSDIFNAVEHTLKTDYVAMMAKEERDVLLGRCVQDKKLCTRSPLMNEVTCHREIDYSMMGLGMIKSPRLTNRLHYMFLAVAGSEELLKDNGVVLGIIGMPRAMFDTMLRRLPSSSLTGKSKASIASGSQKWKSKSSTKRSEVVQKWFPDIVLPRREPKEMFFPPSFPDEPERIPSCNETQRRRWQARLQKLLLYRGARAVKPPQI